MVQDRYYDLVTTAAKGSGASDQNVMIVSGRNVYDAFGRVAKAYYPTTEGMGSKTSFSTAFDNVTPTVTVYDVLDRALSVKLPDESETTTEYTLDSGSNALVTEVTDALGNSQSTVTNGSGKTLKSIKHSGSDCEITTLFEYDGILCLVRMKDTENNVTPPFVNLLTKQMEDIEEEGKMVR